MGKIAFVFAGQGAQAPGMGKEIYEASPAARLAMDAAERMRPGTLAQCFEGPAEALNQTINTQPCLFVVDYACALAAREAGVQAGMAAGFSLGEVAAAAFCGLLSFEAAFRLVVRRAELMQDCAQAHPGAMGAVLRLDAGRVEELCREAADVHAVNYNCPGQTVVACAEAAYEPFCQLVQRERGRVVRLNVSGAFHSPWMQEATRSLKAFLAGAALNAPAIPLYANATARPYEGDFADLLARQVSSPVLWEQTVRNMAADGAKAFVEVGAGRTLTGLIRKILPEARAVNVADREGLEALRGGALL